MTKKCHVIEGENFKRLAQLRKQMGFNCYKDMISWILDFFKVDIK